MTIHQMENTGNGDRRITDGLSRLVDIAPSRYLTRKDWLYLIVRSLLLDGEGNSIVLPKISNDYVADLFPVPPSVVSYQPTKEGYAVRINGSLFDPEDLLHFKLYPDPECPYWGSGIRVLLRDVLKTLAQAGATTRDFLNTPRPAVVVSVDSTEQDLQSLEGRKKIFDKYVNTVDTGDAWVIPGEIIKVEQLKPLSLKDLAISDSVTLDRRFISALFGVPRFFLGTDQYNRGEFNHFITTTLRSICQVLEQEMTRKILISPTRYYRFNPRALLDYSVTELANIGTRLRPVGVMNGNEVRNWVGLDPSDAPGMDDFIITKAGGTPVDLEGGLKGGQDDSGDVGQGAAGSSVD